MEIFHIFSTAELAGPMFKETVLLTFVSVLLFSPVPVCPVLLALSVAGGLCPPVLDTGLPLLKS